MMDTSCGNRSRLTAFGTYGIEISDGLDLLVVICPGQLSKAFWVKLAAVGEELGAVLLGQLCAERVDGDDEGSPVGLELQHRRRISGAKPQAADFHLFFNPK